MNSLLKFLNPSEELRNNLDKFKEAFIEFYGEDSRDEVTEKFSKMLPIGFISPSHQKILLSSIEKKFTETMITKILENNNIEITKNDLFTNYSFEFASLQPIYAYQKFYEVYSLSLEERKAKFYDKGYERITKYLRSITKEEFLKIVKNKQLPEKYNSLPQIIKEQFNYYFNERSFQRDYQKLYENVEPLIKKIIPEADLSNIEEFKNDKRIKELKILLEEYQDALKMYDNFKNSLKEYYEKEEIVSNSEFELQTKYHKKLISKYKYLIPKNKQTNLEDYLVGIKESYTLDNYVKYFFGSSLYSETPLEFFSTNSEELLESDSKWRKKEITNQRIKYFNENGINLGHDYQAYLESEEVKRIWPTSSDVDNFIGDKNNLLNEFNIEFFQSTPDYQKTRAEIEQFNLINKDDSFDASIYNHSKIFVAPNIRKINNVTELFSLLVISFNNYNDNYLDHLIVHELNHIYELCLELVGAKEFSVICGWDRSVDPIKNGPDEIDTINDVENRRPYELFNEIINEIIAQEISKIMHKNNVHVFDNPTTAKYRNGTSYEHSLFLVKDFFIEFKDKIIESRKNGNIQVIWDEVGKENFDELNSLFKIYYENLSGFRIYSLFSDLYEKEDTPLTRIYYDLVDKKNNILEKMRKHQALKKEMYQEGIK